MRVSISGEFVLAAPIRNKARRCAAGPEEGQDEEKETELLGRYSEISDEGATLVRTAPCGPEPLALERIGERVDRHRMGGLGQRRIPGLFIAADMVTFVHRSGLNVGQRPGGKRRLHAVHVVVGEG